MACLSEHVKNSSRRMGDTTRLLFLVLQLLCIVKVQASYYVSCADSPNYTPPTEAFQQNLKRLLDSLLSKVPSNASAPGYYTSIGANATDPVYGLVSCRGDVDREVCRTCVTNVIAQVVQLCPNKKEAMITFQYCLLYYSGTNFFGTLSTSFVSVATNQRDMPGDPQQFMPQMTSFFNKLIVEATTNQPARLFAAGNFQYTDQVTVYAVVQCSADLTAPNCSSCLSQAIAKIQACCANKQGARILSRPCYIKYETFPFLYPLSPNALTSASPISSNCSAASTSADRSTFKGNLKVLLLSMIELAPSTGFFDHDIGLGPQQVYGQVLCRGDVSVSQCWNCTSQASAKILQRCPDSRRAMIWMDYCQLRYSDVDFATIVDTDDRVQRPSPETASDPRSFDRSLRSLIVPLISYATNNSSGQMFATGTSVLTKSQSLYALVQCTRDISVEDCGWCLQTTASDIGGCCEGRLGASILKGSCSLVYGVNRFFLGEPMLKPPDSSSPDQVASRQGLNSWKLAVIVSLIGGILLSACAFCLYRLRQLRLEEQRYNEACLIALNNGPRENEKDLPQISLRIIQLATDNFSDENKLGEGGFGSVFKGRFRNGQLEVAVKRLSASSGQGLKEFRNEVRLIAKLQHKNLVRLIGCCLEKGEKLLIYEYMPNTSLDAFLKDPMKRSTLDWEKRYNIILGTARGVLYLHQDSRLCVIHRDLKAGNVLLDENMNPKISDFGMARIFSASQGQANTKAWSLWCEDKGSEFVDPVIRGNGSMPEMLRCMHIGLLCIQEDATSRPTMSLVVLMLGSNGLFLPTPTRPAFFKIDADSSEPCSSSNGFTQWAEQPAASFS
ncbi:Tyrosine-protein kinase receptor Tie-2 [Nymphaea thermarum]|nr:Tyrosine-protein kinase receptor Tie-2 [Nymphaea thermarum]